MVISLRKTALPAHRACKGKYYQVSLVVKHQVLWAQWWLSRSSLNKRQGTAESSQQTFIAHAVWAPQMIRICHCRAAVRQNEKQAAWFISFGGQMAFLWFTGVSLCHIRGLFSDITATALWTSSLVMHLTHLPPQLYTENATTAHRKPLPPKESRTACKDTYIMSRFMSKWHCTSARGYRREVWHCSSKNSWKILQMG